MSSIEELDEVLAWHGFALQQWAPDGTASWEYTDHGHPGFPLTTRAFIARTGDGAELVFHVEHRDSRSPFYAKPLDRLDLRELDDLLRDTLGEEDEDEDD